MFDAKRCCILFLIGIGVVLILTGLSPSLRAIAQDAPDTTLEAVETAAEVAPVDAEADAEPTADAATAGAEGTPEPIYEISEQLGEVTGDNSYCMVCHNQPWDTVTLGDGTIQNLYVNPDTIAASVHGATSSTGTFGCVDCHGADSFPHNKPSPADDRAYTLYSVSICASCHTDEVHELNVGLHDEAIRAGNRDAAVCTDCHGAHDVQPVVEEPELIAGVCGDCHTSTLQEWRVSQHVDIGPLGCATCHGPHTQRLRAGNSANEICINCHEDTSNVFVHRQHAEAADVSCTSCHMYTEQPHGEQLAVSVTTRPTGHSMQLDSTPCNTCHEELVTSGEWAQLTSARATIAEPVAAPEATAAPETAPDLVAAAPAPTSHVPLIQGLLLGLGFGATFAAVFVARGSRHVKPATPAPEPEPEPVMPVEPPAEPPVQPDETESVDEEP